MSDNYEELKNLVENGKLNLVVVLAPPRTNSTMIEHSLGMSPSIDGEIHEPFISARERAYDANAVYGLILKYIDEFRHEKEKENLNITINPRVAK